MNLHSRYIYFLDSCFHIDIKEFLFVKTALKRLAMIPFI